jgi:hypothetical protein
MNPVQQFIQMMVGIGEARRVGLPDGFYFLWQYCFRCNRITQQVARQYIVGDKAAEHCTCSTCGTVITNAHPIKPPSNAA